MQGPLDVDETEQDIEKNMVRRKGNLHSVVLFVFSL